MEAIDDAIRENMSKIRDYAKKKYNEKGPGVTCILFNSDVEGIIPLTEINNLKIYLFYMSEDTVPGQFKWKVKKNCYDTHFLLKCMQNYISCSYEN